MPRQSFSWPAVRFMAGDAVVPATAGFTAGNTAVIATRAQLGPTFPAGRHIAVLTEPSAKSFASRSRLVEEKTQRSFPPLKS